MALRHSSQTSHFATLSITTLYRVPLCRVTCFI